MGLGSLGAPPATLWVRNPHFPAPPVFSLLRAHWGPGWDLSLQQLPGGPLARGGPEASAGDRPPKPRFIPSSHWEE